MRGGKLGHKPSLLTKLEMNRDLNKNLLHPTETFHIELRPGQNNILALRWEDNSRDFNSQTLNRALLCLIKPFSNIYSGGVRPFMAIRKGGKPFRMAWPPLPIGIGGRWRKTGQEQWIVENSWLGPWTCSISSYFTITELCSPATKPCVHWPDPRN